MEGSVSRPKKLTSKALVRGTRMALPRATSDPKPVALRSDNMCLRGTCSLENLNWSEMY